MTYPDGSIRPFTVSHGLSLLYSFHELPPKNQLVLDENDNVLLNESLTDCFFKSQKYDKLGATNVVNGRSTPKDVAVFCALTLKLSSPLPPPPFTHARHAEDPAVRLSHRLL